MKKNPYDSTKTRQIIIKELDKCNFNINPTQNGLEK